jgi:hypothetical protein
MYENRVAEMMRLIGPDKNEFEMCRWIDGMKYYHYSISACSVAESLTGSRP